MPPAWTAQLPPERSFVASGCQTVAISVELIAAGFFQLFQKMNVPRLVDVMISAAPSLFRSTTATCGADARAVVHQLGHELRAARRLRVAHRPVDVQHRRAVRIGIEVSVQVRPEALAGDEVRMPSPSMSANADPCSSENVTPPAFFVEKSPMIGCSTKLMVPSARFLLLEPRQAPAVRLQAGDDVVQAVAVDVVDANLGAARARADPRAERLRVVGPGPIAAFRPAAPTSRTRSAKSIRPSPLMSPTPMP